RGRPHRELRGLGAGAPRRAPLERRGARRRGGGALSLRAPLTGRGRVSASRPRVLIVGPLPPPMGGVQLMIDMQLRSSLASEFELATVDTSKRQLRWAVENPTWKTPFYFLRDFGRLLRSLVSFRPRVVLVH